MRRVLIAAFAAALGGCDLPDSLKKQVIEEHKRKEAEKKAKDDADRAAAKAAEVAKAGLRERTFRPPVPTDPSGNPVTVAATDAGKRVEQALDDIRRRVAEVRASVAAADPKGKGIVEAANDLRLLVKELRGQTDALKRSAADLIPELLAIDYDYRSASDRFRRRAANYADPQMRDAILRLADDLDWAADDAPRRAELAAQFLAAMGRNAAMLRDADLALGDVAALAAVLDAGAAPKSAKAKAVELDSLLQRFLGLIETFAERMKVPPPRDERPAGERKPAPESDTPVPPAGAKSGGGKAAEGVEPSGDTPPAAEPGAPTTSEEGKSPAPEIMPAAPNRTTARRRPPGPGHRHAHRRIGPHSPCATACTGARRAASGTICRSRGSSWSLRPRPPHRTGGAEMDPIGAILDFLDESFSLGYGVVRTWILRALHAAVAFGLPVAVVAAVLLRFGAVEAVVVCVLLASPAFVWTQRVQQYFDRYFY